MDEAQSAGTAGRMEGTGVSVTGRMELRMDERVGTVGREGRVKGGSLSVTLCNHDRKDGPPACNYGVNVSYHNG
jgi:hypothetical protein